MRRMLCVVAVVILSACGGSKSPTEPAVLQVAGVWRGSETITSWSGGECVGAFLQANAVGVVLNGTVSVQQSGSSVSGTATSDDSGLSCRFTGTVGGTALTLNTTVSSCDAILTTGLRCPNGALRDIELIASVTNGNVSGASMTGTSSSTYNVFVSGTRNGVGILTGRTNIRYNKQ